MQQGGRVRRWVEEGPWRPADQAPATGTGYGVDARLVASDAHTACHHVAAWGGQTRHCQRRREPAKVGEASQKSEEVHPVVGGGMQADYLVGGQAELLGHRRERGSILAAIAHTDAA